MKNNLKVLDNNKNCRFTSMKLYLLQTAFEHRSSELLKTVLKNDFDTTHLNKALVTSSYDGLYKFVKILLKDKRVDPTYNDNISLVWALRHHNWDVTKLLLDHPKVIPLYTLEETNKMLVKFELENDVYHDTWETWGAPAWYFFGKQYYTHPKNNPSNVDYEKRVLQAKITIFLNI